MPSVEKLRKPVYRSFQDGLTVEDEEVWENANIAMKTSLLKRLDRAVESDRTPFQSRSKLVRSIVREKLQEMEADF
jgi:hypothetical protein